MKHPRLKIILTLLLTVLFIIVFVVVTVNKNAVIIRLTSPKSEALETEAISSAIEDLRLSWKKAEEKTKEHYLVSADISAAALRSTGIETVEQPPQCRAESAVVSIQNGILDAPEECIRQHGLEASLFRGKEGLFQAPADPTTLVVYSRIQGSFYYIEWYKDTFLPRVVEKSVNIHGIMMRPEAACGGYSLFVGDDPGASDGNHIIYRNDVFSSCSDQEIQDLVTDVIRRNAEHAKNTLTLNDTPYRYIVSEVSEPGGYLIMLTPKEDLLVKSLSQSTYTTALLILLLFAVTVSASSVSSYIQKNSLTPNVANKYSPANIRRLAILYGAVGIIMIAVAVWLDQSLCSLYEFSVRSRDILNAAQKNIEMNAEWNARDDQNTEQIYLVYGNKIAEVLNDRPELCTGDTLRSFADCIHASSITLYDSQGKETACSGDYIGLELGSDPSSATGEFRRILKGVPSLFQEAATDDATGLYETRLGIRIADPAAEGRYGAMIIALNPALLEHTPGEEINTILGDMTFSGANLWISDLSTGTIIASGSRDMIGKDIYDLGMTEDDLKDALMKNLKTESGNYYIASSVLNSWEDPGETEQLGGTIAYYAEELNTSDYVLLSILASCIAFLLMYAVLVTVSLRGYTDEFFNEYRHTRLPSAPENDDLPAVRTEAVTSGFATLRKKLARAWSAFSPGRRGFVTIEGITVLFLLQQIPLTFAGKEYAKNSVYYYISTGNWNKGLNLFSLAGIANLAAEILLFVIVVQLIMSGLGALSGTKGKTICRLISSLVRYIALFTFLILAFTYLGVDRATIIASIGTFSLALSLGAQALIDDLISGVAIVFEGIFQVGETVKINDFTGKILEIGIRCTRILERDGNIVTISNRNIRQIVNMTQHSSWYPCEITVSSAFEIEDIEKILAEELPKIKEGDNRILRGPIYKGVKALGQGTMTLSVTTECLEEDYLYVRQKVNRELLRIFHRNGMQI